MSIELEELRARLVAAEARIAALERRAGARVADDAHATRCRCAACMAARARLWTGYGRGE